ncbi:ectonucleotide pyrophosphatase/phosphodiesterase family member 5-like [Diadema antillarum]|uniref:ectonucleotide pyrophosphatase/phosphodiesterase family member 5-like n=1 Tax=Diadema antillarum TaxID=105358 RepID=UPI003A849F76
MGDREDRDSHFGADEMKTKSETVENVESKLLLVMFDGFRHDYLDKTDTPNFDRLLAAGAKAASVIPAFTTKTFPGHHTVATGLYQESHGIMGNNMYDPEFDATFNQGTAEPRWWNYGGEPVWVTNQKAGGRSVSVFYPGARVNISGQTATYYQPQYDESMPFEERIDLVVGLMASGQANLGLLYFHEPDSTGHLQGPDSDSIVEAISMCDTTLGYLLDSLTEAELIDDVNIIVTSDHGMANVAAEQTVFLDDYVDSGLYFHTNNDPVFGLWPYNETDGSLTTIYEALKDAHPQMNVYWKEDIPEEYCYRDNRRTSPILIVMDEGWHVWTNRSVEGNWMTYRGNHGFLNTLPSMQTIFIASGPAFKSNFALTGSFYAVDIYNLMCRVLEIDPAPNNGTFSNVEPLLSNAVTVVLPSFAALFLSLVSCKILIG